MGYISTPQTFINGASGSVTLAAGTNTTVTTSGETITISSTGAGGAGVSSLNTLTGAITLAAGTNTTITPSGNTLTISSTGSGGGAPGGTSGQIQYNNTGSFGGFGTYSGTTVALGTVTLSTAEIISPIITTSATSFTASQTGDQFGGSSFVLQNRVGLNGFQVQNPTLDLADMGALTSTGAQGNMRFEHRSSQMNNAGNATFGEYQVFLNAGVGNGNVAAYFGLAACGTIASMSFPSAVVGSPTGGNEGTGTLNAQGLYVNGVAVSTSSGTVTSVAVTPANGLAGTVANSTTAANITLSTTITGVLKGNGTAISAATAGTDYQAPITLTTTGISGPATFSSNTLNIPQYSGVAWSEITTTSVAFAVNDGYVMNNASRVVGTLPSTAAQFSIIRIVGKGAGGWQIAQNSGQTIHFDGNSTTTGASGSLSSQSTFDCVDLLCITANTDFIVTSSIGNLTGI